VTSGTEEEQLAQIREWWQRNGKPLLFGGALALVLVFGWQAWQNRQVTRPRPAATNALLTRTLALQKELKAMRAMLARHQQTSRVSARPARPISGVPRH